MNEPSRTIQLLCTVFDRKGSIYAPPFLAKNEDTAIRQMIQSLTDERAGNSQVVRFPEDFDLVVIATMDIESGLVAGVFPHQLLSSIQTLVSAATAVKVPGEPRT